MLALFTVSVGITHSRFFDDVQVPGNHLPIQHRKMGKSRQPGGLPVLMKPVGPKTRKPRLTRHGPVGGSTAGFGFGTDASWLKQWRLSFSSSSFLLLKNCHKWEMSHNENIK